VSRVSRFLIYGLVDPRTRLIRYVGKSTSGLRRPRGHRNPSNQKATYSARWVEALRREGLTYTIVVLEEQAFGLSLDIAEQWWIAYGRASGWPLTNLTDGGEGTTGWSMRPETKEKIAATKRGRKLSVEHRAKISNTLKANTDQIAHLARLSRENVGRSPSAETLARRSASLRDRTLTPETRRKISESRRTLFGRGAR